MVLSINGKHCIVDGKKCIVDVKSGNVSGPSCHKIPNNRHASVSSEKKVNCSPVFQLNSITYQFLVCRKCFSFLSYPCFGGSSFSRQLVSRYVIFSYQRFAVISSALWIQSYRPIKANASWDACLK